jgi:UDP-glucose 4-epimerase
MNILITGGCGYIGSHLATLFKKKDKVILLDNFYNCKKTVINKIKILSKAKIKIVNSDVNNETLLIKLIKKNQINTVIHLAALKSISESFKYPEKYFTINLNFTINVINAMKKTNCKNLIFSSTAAIYQRPKNKSLFKETDKIFNNILSPYAMSKYLAEETLKNIAAQDKNLNVVCLRYFNVAGAHNSRFLGEDPKNNFDNLFPAIIRSIKFSNYKLKIFGKDFSTRDGTSLRDYVHVIDIARAHISSIFFLKNNKGFNIFNLGMGKGTSVLQIIKEFQDIHKKRIKFIFSKKRVAEMSNSVASTIKAKKILNWKPNFTIHDMCKSAYNYTNNYKKLNKQFIEQF